MIDHEKRIGKPYQTKPPKSAATRAAVSAKLKEWNKAHGNALTLRANRQARKARKG